MGSEEKQEYKVGGCGVFVNKVGSSFHVIIMEHVPVKNNVTTVADF